MNESLTETFKEIARQQLRLRARVADDIITVHTTTHTLSNTDHGKKLVFTSDSLCTITIPAGLESYMDVSVLQAGQGNIKVIGANQNVLIENYQGYNQTAGRLAELRIEAYQPDKYVTTGQMSYRA